MAAPLFAVHTLALPLPVFYRNPTRASSVLRLHRPPALSAVPPAAAAAGRRRTGRRGKKVEKSSGGVGFSELEAEIYDFMAKSEKPDSFPTREELVAGGRADLADAVDSHGGWLSYGWRPSSEKVGDEVVGAHPDYEASPSGRSIEREGEDGDGGGVIEGILSRLERERGWSLVSDWSKKKDEPRPDPKGQTSDSWRNWSLDKAGFAEFEAAEIVLIDEKPQQDGVTNFVGKNGYLSAKRPAINGIEKDELLLEPKEIRSRLQRLESDLTSALDSLRFKVNNAISNESNSDAPASDLQSLSDDWELQETKVMLAQDELRTLRTKIAILEGKVALQITEAQKAIEDKQRRLDAAEAVIGSLRTTKIIWPKDASEVLLVGSFDGWANQRKMEKSAGGIFSLTLRLYPGRYEIKFIVDGDWRVDPLRPVANHHGHENNILIVD